MKDDRLCRIYLFTDFTLILCIFQVNYLTNEYTKKEMPESAWCSVLWNESTNFVNEYVLWPRDYNYVDYNSFFSQQPQGFVAARPTSTTSKQNHEFQTFHIK